jgi:acyl-CoA thioester hydrolase
MTILKLHSEPLRDEWLDAYGHLNEAYYLVPFSTTTWILQEHFDIGVPYFEETGCAIYTVETHMRYLNDVRKPAVMDMESMILDSDPKKIWLAHQMVVDNVICATAEFMLLHYNTRENRTTPMPDAVQRNLQEAELDDVPDWVGRQIRMTKK